MKDGRRWGGHLAGPGWCTSLHLDVVVLYFNRRGREPGDDEGRHVVVTVHRQVHIDMDSGGGPRGFETPGIRDQPELVVDGDPGQERVKCTVDTVHFTLEGPESDPNLLRLLHALGQLGDLGLQPGNAGFSFVI